MSTLNLTEMRNALIDDIKDNVDFTYQTLDFGVKVWRFGDGFDRVNPNVLIQFLPSNRKKFQSVGDVVDYADGDYYRYGYARIELCSFHIYCQETHYNSLKTVSVNGRLLAEFIANQCYERIIKVWENILWDYYASFDRLENIPNIKDVSYFDDVSQTKVYNYDIDVYLRIPVSWDKVPEDYDSESDLTEIVSVEELKEINSNNKNKILVRYDG
jgi:hypothetical protein